MGNVKVKKNSPDPVRAEIISITKILSNKRKTKNQVIKEVFKRIDNLRFKYNFDELSKIYALLPTMCRQIIYTRNIASSIDVVGNGVFGFESEKTQKQLNWFTLILLQHKDEINRFLDYKRKFEYAFLHRQYEVAEKILEEVSTEVSYSFWGLYNTWLLKEYAYSIADKIKYLSELGSASNDSVTYLIFTVYFSRMVEKDISVQRYLDKVETDIYHGYKIHDKPIRFFLESYLNPKQVYFFDSIDGILFGDEESAIIDLYLNMQRILINGVVRNNFDVSKILKRLVNELEDEKLNHLQILLSYDNVKNIYKNESQKIIDIMELIDQYTKMNYENSIQLSILFLEKYPDAIEVCEIFVKSHIYLRKNLVLIGEQESVLNKILKYMHEILLKSDKTDEAISELNNLAFNLSTFDISMQLLFFLNENTGKNDREEFRKISKVSSPILTPNFVDILEKNKKEYLSNLRDIINKESITIEFFEQLLRYNEDISIPLKIEIPKHRINLHKARILFKKHEYSLVIQLLEPVINDIKEFPHLLSEGLLWLYESYVKIDEVDKSKTLYVDYFFQNKYLVNNISISYAIPLMVEKRFIGIAHDITLPIFFYISKAKEYLLFTAYRMFMRAENLLKPSEIDHTKYRLEYVIFFLKNICSQKVLCTDALNFRTQIELDNERVKVCQILAKIDSQNIKLYNEEIEEITQNNKIKERIDEVDNSKIYVDIAGIKNYDLKDFYTHFIRYQKTLEILSTYEEELQFLSLENSIHDIENNVHTKKNYVGSKQQLLNIFLELFTEIRDIYLFSNGHGLDYYLSTRIRHGIIEGQLRKAFSNDGLITVKNSETNEYKNNTELIGSLGIDDEQKEELYALFNKFSNDIDRLITIIKDEYIHIKTESSNTKQNGLFDFALNTWQSSLVLGFKNGFEDIKNDQEFIEECFKSCKTITNFNLQQIQKLFKKQIKQKFIDELDSLENNLKQKVFRSELNNLLGKVAHCRTEIQKEIDLIASWFEQRSKKYMDFVIEDAIDTSSEIIRNILPTVKLNIKKEIDSNFSIKGSYFTHFVDCFKIFFENIVNYSKNNNMIQSDICIEIKRVEHNIECQICNILVEDTNLDQMREHINKQNNTISKNLNTSIIRQDSNSGLIKATNIIKKVIGNDSNNLIMKLNDNSVCIEFNICMDKCT